MKLLFTTLFVLTLSFVTTQAQTKDTVYMITRDTVYFHQNKERIKPIKAELGVLFGTPSGVNLTSAIHANDFIFRLTGMYLPNVYGIQADFGYKFSEEDYTYHAITLSGGVSRFESGDSYDYYYYYQRYDYWDYIGLNYMLNTRGFLFAVGLSAGSGTFSNPQLMLQIGYSYQFR
jgi:hypothetical protein